MDHSLSDSSQELMNTIASITMSKKQMNTIKKRLIQYMKDKSRDNVLTISDADVLSFSEKIEEDRVL